MRIHYIAAALGLLLSSTPVLARADVLDDIGGGGSSSTRSFQREQQRFSSSDKVYHAEAIEQINWTGFMDRLFTLLTSSEYLGDKCPEARKIAEMAKSMGEFNLANCMEKCSIDDENMQMQFGSYYKDLDPNSINGRTFGLKDEKLLTAQYVGDDGHLFYFAMNHLPERLQIGIDSINEAKAGSEDGGLKLDELLNEMGAGDAGMMLGLASSMGIDKMAAEMISGEIALVLYDIPSFEKLDSGDIKPADVGIALLIGLKDASKLEAMISGFGANAGLVAMDTADSGWKGYTIPNAEGVSLVYNNEMAAVVTNASVVEKMKAAHGSGGMSIEPCQYYLDVDLATFDQKVLSPLLELGIGELSGELEEGQELYVPSKEAAFLLELPERSALGHMTASGHFDNGYVAELNMKTAVMKYLMYYLGVGGAIAAQTGAFD